MLEFNPVCLNLRVLLILQRKFQFLFGGERADDSVNFLHCRYHGEGFQLQHHFACLDFGQIENIVNHLKQVLSAGVDVVDALLLFGVDASDEFIPEDFGEPDDGVQRCAEFVAHVCKEIALRTAGILRRILRALHRLFRTFPRGDIRGSHHKPDEVPVPSNRAEAGTIPIAADPALHIIRGNLPCLNNFGARLPEPLVMLYREKVKDASPDNVFNFQPDTARDAVEKLNPIGEIHRGDEVWRAFDKRTPLRLRIPQRLFSTRVFGDIPRDTTRALDAAISIADRHFGSRNPSMLSIRPRLPLHFCRNRFPRLNNGSFVSVSLLCVLAREEIEVRFVDSRRRVL